MEFKDIPAITSRAAEALKGDTALSSHDLAKLLAELFQTLGDTNLRLEAIKPGAPGYEGLARRAALTTGTAEEVAAMDEEHKRLAIEAQRMEAQVNALRDRVEKAQASENAKDMPDQYKRLEKAVAAAEKARAALDDALKALDVEYSNTWQQRGNARRSGHDVPGASVELCERLERLRLFQPPKVRVMARVVPIREELGAGSGLSRAG